MASETVPETPPNEGTPGKGLICSKPTLFSTAFKFLFNYGECTCVSESEIFSPVLQKSQTLGSTTTKSHSHSLEVDL